MLSELWVRARATFRRKAVERELDDELRFHVERQAEKYVAAGMAREEAARRARLEFGGVEQMKEECRDARGVRWLESLWQDVRFGMRVLRRSPGFTAIAVTTLALGIGANTAIFSAAYGILLKPLGYAHPGRLVSVTVAGPWGEGDASIGEVADLAGAPAIFESVAGARWGDLRLMAGGAPASVDTQRVTGSYFSTLGVRPMLGNPILPEQTEAGRDNVIVLSYTFWQRQFGGDPAIVGKRVTPLAGRLTAASAATPSSYTIIGVMPPTFHSPGYGGNAIDAWTPLVLSDQEKLWHSTGDALIVGRLKPGLSVEHANAALQTFTAGLARQYPFFRGCRFDATPLLDETVQSVRLALLVLLAAVGLVLLIACVNVSNLALARGWGRTREFALREALGATRMRVVRQLLVESLMLSLGGGAIGLLIGIWGIGVLRAIAPANTPRLDELHFSAAIFWYTLGIALLAGIVFGLAPAIQISGKKLDAAMKGSGLTSLALPQTRGSGALRNGLIVSEVALAVILVVGSALMIRSFDKLISLPLGFRTERLVTVDLDLSPARPDESIEQVRNILGHIRAIPGVENAALSTSPPLLGGIFFGGLAIEGQPESSGSPGASVGMVVISPEYFRTAGISLVRGREFSLEDRTGTPPVAIVNQAFAARYLSGGAVGKHISLGPDKHGQSAWTEIVGEASDSCDFKLSAHARPELYLPFAQGYMNGTTLLIRDATESLATFPAIRRAIWSVDKDAVVDEPRTAGQILASSAAVAEPKFRAVLLGAFGALGLALALVGIYGVISYSVSSRTHEIGIRMALGAQRGDILRAVIGRGLLLSGAGIAIGVGGALGVTRLLRSLLFEVTPTDPATFGGVAILFAIVALAACYVPARRAMRVDPVIALRHE